MCCFVFDSYRRSRFRRVHTSPREYVSSSRDRHSSKALVKDHSLKMQLRNSFNRVLSQVVKHRMARFGDAPTASFGGNGLHAYADIPSVPPQVRPTSQPSLLIARWENEKKNEKVRSLAGDAQRGIFAAHDRLPTAANPTIIVGRADGPRQRGALMRERCVSPARAAKTHTVHSFAQDLVFLIS